MSSAEASLQSALADLRRSPLNVAVVGLNPSDKSAIPRGIRATEFAAGPKLNPDGGPGGEKGAAITVPDLYVKGGGAEARPTLMARLNAAPTSAAALRGMSKYAPPAPGDEPMSARPAARRVSSAPSSRFDGREVYSMAIQMPNITSFSGSWLMWYASRTMTSLQGPRLVRRCRIAKWTRSTSPRPPPIVSKAACSCMCVINGAGKVDHVELLRGIDERLDRSAMDALAKWEFTPATRCGVPVDVDVMVEIPFKLAPKTAGAMKSQGRQHLIFDADDTLWENNIYFEQAFEDFCAFLAHSRLTPAEVREALDEIEIANNKVHGYGALNFARNLRQCYSELVEREWDANHLETIESLRPRDSGKPDGTDGRSGGNNPGAGRNSMS